MFRRTFTKLAWLFQPGFPGPICPVCKFSAASSIDYYFNVNGTKSDSTFKGSYIGKPSKICPNCGVHFTPMK